jgi:hypothetical protein
LNHHHAASSINIIVVMAWILLMTLWLLGGVVVLRHVHYPNLQQLKQHDVSMAVLVNAPPPVSPRRSNHALRFSKSTTMTTTKTTTQHHPQQQQQRHTHAIPNILIFTYSKNLLEPHVVLDNDEEVALQANVKEIVKAHHHSSSKSIPPPPTVRFLTNDDCLQSIRQVLGSTSSLLGYFQTEPKGMFRADICRGAALYETGGIYFDVDLGLVPNNDNDDPHHDEHHHDGNAAAAVGLWKFLQRNTTFCTVLVHEQSQHVGNFFQAFLASTPANPILYQYLQYFIEYYQQEQEQDTDGNSLALQLHRKPLGVILLRMAYDTVMNRTTTTLTTNHHHHHVTPSPPPQVVELWQEVLYHPSYFPHVPPPMWGKKRACHFVVVIPATGATALEPRRRQGEEEEEEEEPRVQVPLYSRIAGSRQCQEHPNAKP